MEAEARDQLRDELQAGDVLLEDTFAVSQILSELYDPPAGAASTTLTLSMQVEFSALYADASDLTKLASLALNASIPAGFSAVSDALTLTPVTKPILNDDGFTRWTVRAERRIFQQVSPAHITQIIQGSSSSRAQTLLEKNVPLEDVPEIKLSPAWWPWVPIVPFRISVVTE